MMSKSKNGGNSWGTLYGRPMDGLAFCNDRHKEITIYIWMGISFNGNACVLKFLAGFVIPGAIQYNLIFTTFRS